MKRFNYYSPSLGESWALVAILIFGMMFAGILFAFTWKEAPQFLTYGVGMVFPLAFAFRQGGRRSRMGMRSALVEHADLGEVSLPVYIILLFIAQVSLIVILDPTTAFIPMPDFVKSIFEKAFVNLDTYDLILSTCVLAPLCEELLCRGLIMKGLLSNGASARKAILWSAFIFAFIHFNPWQSIPAFAIGLFFGWVYWRTGSIWSTIGLHALNNGLSAILSQIWPDISVDTALLDILPTGLYIVIYVAALALMFFAVSLLNRKLPKPLCIKNSTL